MQLPRTLSERKGSRNTWRRFSSVWNVLQTNVDRSPMLKTRAALLSLLCFAKLKVQHCKSRSQPADTTSNSQCFFLPPLPHTNNRTQIFWPCLSLSVATIFTQNWQQLFQLVFCLLSLQNCFFLFFISFFFNFLVFFRACIYNFVTQEKILGKANNYCRIADRIYVLYKKMIGENQ